MFKIFDLHNDYPTSNQGDGGINNFDCQHPRPLDIVVNAFWTTKTSDPIDYIKDYIKQEPPTKNRLYAIEDLWFVKAQEDLDAVCAMPIVYAGLTWNNDNCLAGGALENGRLTEWGRHVVKMLVANNIIIDTAHLNRKSFYDLIEVLNQQLIIPQSSLFIINSHTCLNSLYSHPRNLTNHQIKTLINSGGIIGLTPVGQFISQKENAVSIQDFAEQIDYFCQKYGDKNLAIGSDFFGAPPLKGLSCYSDFNSLYQLLQKKGYSSKTIDKIFYKNAYDFCLQKIK